MYHLFGLFHLIRFMILTSLNFWSRSRKLLIADGFSLRILGSYLLLTEEQKKKGEKFEQKCFNTNVCMKTTIWRLGKSLSVAKDILFLHQFYFPQFTSQPAFTCSNLKKETPSCLKRQSFIWINRSDQGSSF